MNRHLRTGGWLLLLTALHLAISFGIFAYVFKASFWVGNYAGVPLVDMLLYLLWWPILAAEPLLPDNFLSQPYGIVIVIANSIVWVGASAMIVALFRGRVTRSPAT